MSLFVTSKFSKNPPSIIQQELNVNFVKRSSGYQFEPRNNILVNLDESLINSGDFLMITRLDGVD